MRKFSLIWLLVFSFNTLGLAQVVFAKTALKPYQEPELSGPAQPNDAVNQGTLDERFEALTKEMEKEKELLDIWKDHVRTLTKERDEAYKQIEALKDQGDSSSAGKSTADLESELKALRSENERLTASLSEKKPAESDNVTTENSSLRSDNDILLKEKAEAAQKLEYLTDQMSLLRKKYDQLQSENQKLQTAAAQNQENRVKAAQFAVLQAKAEKMKIIEKEYQETKDYFSSYTKDLDAKNKRILQENEALKSENQKIQAEKDKETQLQQELTQLKTENNELQETRVRQSNTIHTLKTTIQSSLDALGSNCGDQKKS